MGYEIYPAILVPPVKWRHGTIIRRKHYCLMRTSRSIHWNDVAIAINDNDDNDVHDDDDAAADDDDESS